MVAPYIGDSVSWLLGLVYGDAVAEAPVVQWIEQIRPKDKIEVRFLSGAQYCGLVANGNAIFDKKAGIKENVSIHSFLFFYVTESYTN